MIKTRPYLLAFLIASSCISTSTHTGFVSKVATFLTGAIIGGPYIRALCSSPADQSFSSLHQKAWLEVGTNISCVWKHTQELAAYLKHITHNQSNVVEKESKENERKANQAVTD